LAGYSSKHANREGAWTPERTPDHGEGSRDDVLAEIAFEPIDGHERRRFRRDKAR
jgi:hypothetical protein